MVTVVDVVWRVGLNVAYRVLLVVWFVARPRAAGVLVAIWHEGRVLLIRNSYRPGYSVPAGYLGRSEEPLLAAVREVREEVGVVLQPEALRLVREWTSRDEYKHDHLRLFEVTLDRGPEVEIDRREVVWAGFRTRDEALGLDLAPYLREYLSTPDPPGASDVARDAGSDPA